MTIEPGTSPKHRYELIKATLLVIVGALITITIVYGVPYFSPKEVADPIEPVVSVPEVKPTPVVENTPTPTQETPKEKVYTQDELNTIFEMDKKKAGTKLFYSSKLGVGFTYIDNGGASNIVSIREVDNDIYFDYPGRTDTYPKLEVFTKDPKDTLDQAVTKEFLAGADSKDCFIVSQKDSSVKSNPFVTTEIGYTIPKNQGDNPFFYYSNKCPEKARPYAKTNGGQNFFMQPEKSSQYGFVRIGQDMGPLSGFSDILDWSETIRFLK
jgi:hypothetical protein